MKKEQFILTSIPLRQLNAMISAAVSKALKAHQSENANISESDEKLLTVKEAADFLNLSIPTVYSKVSRGELPVMKRGKKLHFSSTELMQYLKAGRKLTNAEIQAKAEEYLTKKGGQKHEK